MENKKIELQNDLKKLIERKEHLENILKVGESHLVIAELCSTNQFPEINKTLISFPYLKIAILSEIEAINKSIYVLEKYAN